MPKGRKPVLSLAAAIHRATPAAAATLPAALPAAASASTPGTGVAGGNSKKRKRTATPAQLISAFHVLQREQDALAARKSSLSADAYARAHAALEAKLAALGGLEAYQSLSIAGHSNTKYRAFNTSHWVLRVLASYPHFANLKPLAAKTRMLGLGAAASGTTEQNMDDAPESIPAAEQRRLARRQKEREKKRARKRQRKAEEEAAAAAAAAPAGKKGKAQPAQASAGDDEEDDEVDQLQEEGESDEEVDEESGDGGAGASTASGRAGPPPEPLFSSTNRVRLLDVGAITNHYLPYASQIDCTAIDLNPQHPSVEKRDFFTLDHKAKPWFQGFDVVVLSLVLNFVGDRFARGDMIKRSVAMLRPDGLGRLFIVLPAACLRNSRWMDHDSFVTRCMRPLGLRLGQWKYTNKLACYEFVREEVQPEEEEPEPQPQQQEGEAAQGAEAAGATPAAAEGKKPVVPPKKKKKGFQPAGIVLAGETRNNFSIAWRAD